MEKQDNELIALLYDTVLEPGLWPKFLEALYTRIGDVQAICILTTNTMDAGLTRYDVYGVPMSETYLLAYSEHQKDNDPLLQRVSSDVPGKFLASNLHLDESHVHDDFYLNWALPQNICRAAMGVVHREGAWVTFLTIQRGKEHREFTQIEIDFLETLSPHIRRAIQLQSRFHEMSQVNSNLLALIEQFPYGVALVDAQLRCEYSNASFRSLLANSDALCLRDKYLSFHDRRQAGQFTFNLMRILQGGEIEQDAVTNVLRVKSLQHEELCLLTVPLKLPDANGHVVLMAYAPGVLNPPDREALAVLFDFTPAESQLCVHLAAGLSLEQASTQQRKTKATLRSYLKSVFAKTGVHSQSELVSLILNSPAYFPRLLGKNDGRRNA